MSYNKLPLSEKIRLCEEVELSRDSLSVIAEKNGIARRSLDVWIKKYRAGEFGKQKINKSDLRAIEAENARLKQTIENLKTLENQPKSETIKIEPIKQSDERAAFILASDWHVEERVRADTIHGLNEFNIEIARQRAINFFSNSVELLKRESVDVVVLALLGDFISGYIHEELEEGNNMSPTQALWLCFEDRTKKKNRNSSR